MTKEKIIGITFPIKNLKIMHKCVIKAMKEDSKQSIEINTYLDDISKILDFVDQMELLEKNKTN